MSRPKFLPTDRSYTGYASAVASALWPKGAAFPTVVQPPAPAIEATVPPISPIFLNTTLNSTE